MEKNGQEIKILKNGWDMLVKRISDRKKGADKFSECQEGH